MITAKKSARFILLFALLFLVLPFALRALQGNVYLVGENSYYHARIARQISGQGVPGADNFIVGGRDYVINPYHIILALFAFAFGAAAASKILPFILGLIGVYLLYILLDKFRVGSWKKVVIAGIFVLSPVFIYVFCVSGPACLALVLSLAGVFFLTKKTRIFSLLSFVCFGVVSLFGVLHAVVSAFIVFFYCFRYRKRLKKGYWLIAGIIFVLLSYAVPLYLSSESTGFAGAELLSSFFADVGCGAGFSIFALLLALVGYSFVWRHKTRFYLLYVFSIAVIMGSYFFSDLVIYANLVIVFLAGSAFVILARMSWRLKILRDLTLIVLFCGLLFSAFTAVFCLQDSLPNSALVNSLVWLDLNSEEGAVVFSHHSNGFWIEFIADRPVVLDGLFSRTPGASERYSDSRDLFYTDDLENAKDILSKYGVDYVLISENMVGGLVWENRESGLLFLLTNDETFKKVHQNSYVAIYEYVSEGGQ